MKDQVHVKTSQCPEIMDPTKNVSDLLGQIQQNLQCSICLELLNNPVATKCDHNFCSFCISTFLNTKRTVPCPLCKTSVTKRSLQSRTELNLIISGVKRLIVAFEKDTGESCSPSKRPQHTLLQATPQTSTSGKQGSSSQKKKTPNSSTSKGRPKRTTAAKDTARQQSSKTILSGSNDSEPKTCTENSLDCNDGESIERRINDSDGESVNSKLNSRRALLKYLEEGAISHPDSVHSNVHPSDQVNNDSRHWRNRRSIGNMVDNEMAVNKFDKNGIQGEVREKSREEIYKRNANKKRDESIDGTVEVGGKAIRSRSGKRKNCSKGKDQVETIDGEDDEESLPRLTRSRSRSNSRRTRPCEKRNNLESRSGLFETMDADMTSPLSTCSVSSTQQLQKPIRPVSRTYSKKMKTAFKEDGDAFSRAKAPIGQNTENVVDHGMESKVAGVRDPSTTELDRLDHFSDVIDVENEEQTVETQTVVESDLPSTSKLCKKMIFKSKNQHVSPLVDRVDHLSNVLCSDPYAFRGGGTPVAKKPHLSKSVRKPRSGNKTGKIVPVNIYTLTQNSKKGVARDSNVTGEITLDSCVTGKGGVVEKQNTHSSTKGTKRVHFLQANKNVRDDLSDQCHIDDSIIQTFNEHQKVSSSVEQKPKTLKSTSKVCVNENISKTQDIREDNQNSKNQTEVQDGGDKNGGESTNQAQNRKNVVQDKTLEMESSANKSSAVLCENVPKPVRGRSRRMRRKKVGSRQSPDDEMEKMRSKINDAEDYEFMFSTQEARQHIEDEREKAYRRDVQTAFGFDDFDRIEVETEGVKGGSEKCDVMKVGYGNGEEILPGNCTVESKRKSLVSRHHNMSHLKKVGDQEKEVINVDEEDTLVRNIDTYEKETDKNPRTKNGETVTGRNDSVATVCTGSHDNEHTAVRTKILSDQAKLFCGSIQSEMRQCVRNDVIPIRRTRICGRDVASSFARPDVSVMKLFHPSKQQSVSNSPIVVFQTPQPLSESCKEVGRYKSVVIGNDSDVICEQGSRSDKRDQADRYGRNWNEEEIDPGGKEMERRHTKTGLKLETDLKASERRVARKSEPTVMKKNMITQSDVLMKYVSGSSHVINVDEVKLSGVNPSLSNQETLSLSNVVPPSLTLRGYQYGLTGRENVRDELVDDEEDEKDDDSVKSADDSIQTSAVIAEDTCMEEIDAKNKIVSTGQSYPQTIPDTELTDTMPEGDNNYNNISNPIVVEDTFIEEIDAKNRIVNRDQSYPRTIPDTELTDIMSEGDNHGQECDNNDNNPTVSATQSPALYIRGNEKLLRGELEFTKSCCLDVEDESEKAVICVSDEQNKGTFPSRHNCIEDDGTMNSMQQHLSQADLTKSSRSREAVSQDVVVVPSFDSNSESPTMSPCILTHSQGAVVKSQTSNMMYEPPSCSEIIPQNNTGTVNNSNICSLKKSVTPVRNEINEQSKSLLDFSPKSGKSHNEMSSPSVQSKTVLDKSLSSKKECRKRRNDSPLQNMSLKSMHRVPGSAPGRVNFSDSDDEKDGVLIVRRSKRKCLSLESNPLKPVVFGAIDMNRPVASNKVLDGESTVVGGEGRNSFVQGEGCDPNTLSLGDQNGCPATENKEEEYEVEQEICTPITNITGRVEVTPVGKFRYVDDTGGIVVDANIDSEGEENLIRLSNSQESSCPTEAAHSVGIFHDAQHSCLTDATPTDILQDAQNSCVIGAVPSINIEDASNSCLSPFVNTQDVQNVQISGLSNSNAATNSANVVVSSEDIHKRKTRRGFARKNNAIHMKLLLTQPKEVLSPKAKAAILKEFTQNRPNTNGERMDGMNEEEKTKIEDERIDCDETEEKDDVEIHLKDLITDNELQSELEETPKIVNSEDIANLSDEPIPSQHSDKDTPDKSEPCIETSEASQRSKQDDDKIRLEEELFGVQEIHSDSESEVEDIHFDIEVSPNGDTRNLDQVNDACLDTMKGDHLDNNERNVATTEEKSEKSKQNSPRTRKLSKDSGTGKKITETTKREVCEGTLRRSSRRGMSGKRKMTCDEILTAVVPLDESDLDNSLDCQPLSSSILDNAENSPPCSFQQEDLEQSLISVQVDSSQEENDDKNSLGDDDDDDAVAVYENDDFIAPSKIRKRQRIASDSDEERENGHSNNSENTSSAFSSQSELLTTPQRDALEKDVADLQKKIATFEAAIQETHEVTASPSKDDVVTVADSPLYDDERDDDNDNVEQVNDSDEDLFIHAPSPSPPEKPPTKTPVIPTRPVLSESGIQLKTRDLVKQFQSPGGSLHKRRPLLEFSRTSETTSKSRSPLSEWNRRKEGVEDNDDDGEKNDANIETSCPPCDEQMEMEGHRSPVIHPQGSKLRSGSGQSGQDTALNTLSSTILVNIVASGLNGQEMQLLQKLCSSMANVRHSARFGPGVTHVVMKTVSGCDSVCERTLKYFQGLAHSVWIVSLPWLLQSLEAGQVLAERDFEIMGDTSGGDRTMGPKRARLNKGTLFKDYSFACVGNSNELRRDNMEELLSLCGGCVVDDIISLPLSEQENKIIIRCTENEMSDIERTMLNGVFESAGVISVKRDWVLDCISSYRIFPVDNYLLTGFS